MSYCFEKAKTPVANEGRNKIVPCIILTGIKRRMYDLLQAVLSCWNPPRLREIWIHSYLFASFDMVEAFFSDLPDELWYSNFRVTLGTFTYILNETGDEISPNRTFHAKSCYSKSTTRNSFVPIALSYLTSTAECRTTPGKQSWHHFILVLNFVQISPS